MSWSCDQDGPHVHIWQKAFKNLLLRNQLISDLRTSYTASGIRRYKVCPNDDPGLTVTYFTARSVLLYELDFVETIEVIELKVGTNS